MLRQCGCNKLSVLRASRFPVLRHRNGVKTRFAHDRFNPACVKVVWVRVSGWTRPVTMKVISQGVLDVDQNLASIAAAYG